MEITQFLASLWGPAILAIAIGVFTSKNYYIRIYRDLEKDTLAVLIFGMAAIAVGIAQIQAHNTWNSLPEIVISVLGWGTLIKGILFIVAPRFVDRIADSWANFKLIPVAGGLMLLVGGYLTWFAYLA